MLLVLLAVLLVLLQAGRSGQRTSSPGRCRRAVRSVALPGSDWAGRCTLAGCTIGGLSSGWPSYSRPRVRTHSTRPWTQAIVAPMPPPPPLLLLVLILLVLTLLVLLVLLPPLLLPLLPPPLFRVARAVARVGPPGPPRPVPAAAGSRSPTGPVRRAGGR